MTTVQLAQRLMRYLTVPDIALLPTDGALELLDAINAGIQTFFRLAPRCYSQYTINSTLGAPITATLNVTQGQAAFTGYDATGKEYQTVSVGDDEFDHRLASGGTFLDNYQGTTGAQVATIYGDVIPFDIDIERIIKSPLLDGNSLLSLDDSFITETTRTIGQPTRYALERAGFAQSEDPAFYLRVDPLPDTLYRVHLEVEGVPSRVVFVDLTTPKALPIAEGFFEAYLLPLCAGGLVGSEWLKEGAEEGIEKKEGRALQMVPMLTSRIDAPANQCGTPVGF